MIILCSVVLYLSHNINHWKYCPEAIPVELALYLLPNDTTCEKVLRYERASMELCERRWMLGLDSGEVYDCMWIGYAKWNRLRVAHNRSEWIGKRIQNLLSVIKWFMPDLYDVLHLGE